MEDFKVVLCKNKNASLDDIIKFSNNREWLVKNARYTIDGISIVPFKSENGVYLLLVNIYRPRNKLIYNLSENKIWLSSMTPYSEKKTFSMLKDNKHIIMKSIKEDLA